MRHVGLVRSPVVNATLGDARDALRLLPSAVVLSHCLPLVEELGLRALSIAANQPV
jgi:hypothetical protein